MVPDNVFSGEFADLNAFDALENTHSIYQTAAGGVG
jgi:hypothetical protein